MRRHGSQPVHLFPAGRRHRLRAGLDRADLRARAPGLYIQGVDSIYDLDWNGAGVTYRDVYHQAELEFSAFNFEYADTAIVHRQFEDAEKQCRTLLDARLALPAYDQCLKASHLFNLLDARGVIGVNERASFIARVRALAKACCEAWLTSRKAA